MSCNPPIKARRKGCQADKDLKQGTGTERVGSRIQQGNRSVFQHLEQIGMHLSQVLPNGSEAGMKDSVGLTESQKHLRTWRGELAVAQIGNLGVVHTPQIESIGQSRQHLVRPTVSLMPNVNEMSHRLPALSKLIAVTPGHMISIIDIAHCLIRIRITYSLRISTR